MTDRLFDVRYVGRVSVAGGSCIVATPLDNRTLCGKHTKEVGTTWAKWVQPAIDATDPPWCEMCLYLWQRTGV